MAYPDIDLSKMVSFAGDNWVKMTKISSKRRSTYGIGPGHTVAGKLTIQTEPDGAKRVNVEGLGWDGWLMTSPVVKLLDETENSLLFETEGGVYKLEK